MRRLDADEKALWARVVATVRPLHPQSEPVQIEPVPELPAEPARARAQPAAPAPTISKPRPGETLDGSWDRRLARGSLQPDIIVDLHGHNLATAYAFLDERLETAIANGKRMMLLITGKAPGSEPTGKRGAIRAAVGDWLTASRHAAAIAAVRNAHPRHGGAGALYIILRRPGLAVIRKRSG